MDKKTIQQMMDIGIESDKILQLMMAREEKKDAEESVNIMAAIEKLSAAVEALGASGGEKKPEEEESEKADPVLDAIQRLTGMMAGKNIRNMGSEAQPESADDILAKVLIGKPKEGD